MSETWNKENGKETSSKKKKEKLERRQGKKLANKGVIIRKHVRLC